MENKEIKVTEETMVAEGVVEETKTNFLQKVGAGVTKHGKKIAVAGAAVLGIGLIVARAALKKNVDDNYDEASFEDEDDFEAEEVTE